MADTHAALAPPERFQDFLAKVSAAAHAPLAVLPATTHMALMQRTFQMVPLLGEFMRDGG
ncbi:hypothetical protein ACIRP7_21380 [Streptomyces sp. NPDC102270]|uniref:hypothetical protein n=1 Tax=Streptomyces sp. NPDC102270 TaxID=3366150 RepID=UPI00382331BF